MGLTNFERRLERLVEGAFSRTFRVGLQPVEIGKRIAREMDLQRTMGPRTVIAPNVFEVLVSEKDMERFHPFRDALVHELRQTVKEHARDEGYALVGPVEVFFDEDPSLKAGVFSLAAEVQEDEGAPWLGALLLPDGSEVPVPEGVISIGRLPDCDVVISDPSVSRHHAELHSDIDRVVIVDLSSTNGSRVNGVLVQERALRDGDTVSIGNSVLKYRAI